MAPAVDMLHLVSPLVAGLLVASIWQSILLTGAVALCLRFVPRVPAGTRSSLWTAVLILIVALPAFSLLVPHVTATHGPAVHLANDWSLGLLCFWAMLSIFRALQLCLSAVRLWTLTRSAKPVDAEKAIAPLLTVGSRKIVLCTSEQVDRPSVVGFFQPRILLPPELLKSLSAPELEQIVLHEIEHLRRGDQWTNLLQQVSLVLLPWNPAVVWLNRQLCFERELACDDAVMRATKARKTYAACLVRLAEDSMLRRGISLALGALGAFEVRARESELVTRVRRILTVKDPGARSKSLRFATAVMLAGALGLSVLLARSPRLVDFASMPVTVAAATPLEAPALATALPVSPANLPSPTLVKAVVSGPGSNHAVITTSLQHKRSVARHRTLRAGAGPSVEVPVWRDRVPSSRRPVMTLTAIEDSQHLYAAVPWPGGWLLIQL